MRTKLKTLQADAVTGEIDLGKALGRVIAQKRKSMSLSQNDLAGMIDVDAETISRFERGAVVPSLLRLNALAKAMDVSLGTLLSQSSQFADDQTNELLLTMRTLEATDRKMLMDISQLMLQRKRLASAA
jgi:transcriptional regulator with XRE-family HTH domain